MPFSSVISPDSLTAVPAASEQLLSLPEQSLGVYIAMADGIKGEPRQSLPADNPWIATLLLVCFLLVTVGYRTSGKFVQYLVGEVFDYRGRSFAPKASLGVFRLKLLLMLMTFVLEGVALFMVYTQLHPERTMSSLSAFALVGIFTGGFLLWYVVRSLLLRLLVYVFSSAREIPVVAGALSATTVLLGLLLFIPVLVFVYYTFPLHTFIIVLAVLYASERILFICRGVNVFFGNIYSAVYLILYLCTVEIAPVLTVYKGLCLLFSFDLKLF